MRNMTQVRGGRLGAPKLNLVDQTFSKILQAKRQRLRKRGLSALALQTSLSGYYNEPAQTYFDLTYRGTRPNEFHISVTEMETICIPSLVQF